MTRTLVAGAEELKELQKKEMEMKVQPDWEIDAFTKAQIRTGKRHSIVTDLILKLLGLDVCSSLAFDLNSTAVILHIIPESLCPAASALLLCCCAAAAAQGHSSPLRHRAQKPTTAGASERFVLHVYLSYVVHGE